MTFNFNVTRVCYIGSLALLNALSLVRIRLVCVIIQCEVYYSFSIY
jgi:hypothetical protein